MSWHELGMVGLCILCSISVGHISERDREIWFPVVCVWSMSMWVCRVCRVWFVDRIISCARFFCVMWLWGAPSQQVYSWSVNRYTVFTYLYFTFLIFCLLGNTSSSCSFFSHLETTHPTDIQGKNNIHHAFSLLLASLKRKCALYFFSLCDLDAYHPCPCPPPLFFCLPSIPLPLPMVDTHSRLTRMFMPHTHLHTTHAFMPLHFFFFIHFTSPFT